MKYPYSERNNKTPRLPDPSMSLCVGPTDAKLMELNSWELLAMTAETYPDHDALVSPWQQQRLSYTQLLDQASQVAAGLRALAVQAGDRLGVWGANRVEWIVFQFAAAKLGAILVNVNPAYREGELQYVIEDSGCSVLALSCSYRGHDNLAAARAVRKRHPGLRSLVLLDDADVDGCVRWSQLLRLGAERVRLEEAGPAINPRAPANLQYTSGTTGKPKGTTLSHFSLVNNAAMIVRRLQLNDADRVCLPVPLFHCFGMVIGVLGAVASGAAVVLPGENFDPAGTLEAVERERCTALYAVPTMFIALMNDPQFDSARVSTLKKGLMGGSLCPPSVVRDTVEKMHMKSMSLVYGMTETSPISVQSFPDDSLEDKQNSVGRPQDHTEVRVVDPVRKTLLPVGEIGELQVRGYLVMLGYWKNPEATRNTVDAEGWLSTGDLATMNQRGFVQIVGRSKDMVIRGGENIYPREVEDVLRELEGVADAHVFGIPDDYYGEQLCAWIKLRPDAQSSEQQIRDGCKQRVASYKVPGHIRFVDEYPCTASGKVQKFRMRELEIEMRAVRLPA